LVAGRRGKPSPTSPLLNKKEKGFTYKEGSSHFYVGRKKRKISFVRVRNRSKSSSIQNRYGEGKKKKNEIS